MSTTVLVYDPGDGRTSIDVSVYTSIYLQPSKSLAHAYAAVVRLGHRPTKWRRRGQEVTLNLDQAEHWRGLMERGQL